MTDTDKVDEEVARVERWVDKAIERYPEGALRADLRTVLSELDKAWYELGNIAEFHAEVDPQGRLEFGGSVGSGAIGLFPTIASDARRISEDEVKERAAIAQRWREDRSELDRLRSAPPLFTEADAAQLRDMAGWWSFSAAGECPKCQGGGFKMGNPPTCTGCGWRPSFYAEDIIETCESVASRISDHIAK